MPKFSFVVSTSISMSTDVEADTLEQAIEEAKSRGPVGLCHQCSRGEPDEEWITSGEFDCDPGAGDLLGVYEGREDV